MKHPRHQERGLALIVVLVTMMLTITTCVTLSRLVSTSTVQRRDTQRSVQADDLLREAQKAIFHWLDESSAETVLPPETRSASLTILHDELRVRGEPLVVRITAWDQRGMIPLPIAHSSSPIRFSLPTELLGHIETLPAAATGLDSFLGHMPAQLVFPLPGPEASVSFHDSPAQSLSPLALSPDMAFGAWISPLGGEEKININTAPMRLVEATLRALGRGGADVIRRARQSGKLSTATGGPPSKEAIVAPALTSTSDCWSFRVDLRVGPLRKSWWSLYQRDPTWRCVQRIAIPS